MRFLIDHSGYELRNLGDAAMLQVCIDRIRAAYPDAEIDVITTDAERLAELSPGARPIRSTLVDRRPFRSMSRSHRLGAEQIWKTAAPYLIRGHRPADGPSIMDAIRSADAVVAAGGGYLTDIWWWHAAGVFAVLAAAQRLGKRTAMFGQGLGPLTHPLVRPQAAAVLPRLGVLGLREGLIGPPLAQKLGVPADRVMVTGDDAMALAVAVEPAKQADWLGVNVRVANYTALDESTTLILRRVLGAAAADLDTGLLALPVSRYHEGDDLEDIRGLLSELPGDRVALPDLTTPQSLADAAGNCRAVVTASYHAAVFALAAGVPAVCLTRSAYYDGKFGGLAAFFPETVTVVPMAEPNLEQRLSRAVHDAWTAPERVRAASRAIALSQVSDGASLYDRFLHDTASGHEDETLPVLTP